MIFEKYKKEVSDDFFEIGFDQSETNKSLKLCNDYQNTYSEQDKIDGILSHLTTIDETKRENKRKGGDFKSEMIDFTISYGLNGKKVSEKMSVPLGYGHSEKGINFLRDNFSQGLGLNPEERIVANSDDFRKRLDNECKGFKKPTLDIADLQSLGYGTIDTCVETAKALSNEELGAFLKGFQEQNRQERSKRTNKPIEVKEDELINALAEKLGIDSKELKESIEQHSSKKSVLETSFNAKDLTQAINSESSKSSSEKDSAKETSKFNKNPTPSEVTKKKMAAKRSEIAKTKKAQAADKSKASEMSKINPPLNIERTLGK